MFGPVFTGTQCSLPFLLLYC